MITSHGPNSFGISLNPVKAVKSAAKGVAKGAKVVTKNAGTVVKVALAPALVLSKLAADVALKPIRSRINTLKSERAKKLAWDRRRSTTPNAAENNEARAWAKTKLKAQGPHGTLLALLAGAPPENMLLGGGYISFGEPVTITAAALVPVLIAVLNNLMKKSAAGGEIGVDVQAQGTVQVPQSVQKYAQQAQQTVQAVQAAQQAYQYAQNNPPNVNIDAQASFDVNAGANVDNNYGPPAYGPPYYGPSYGPDYGPPDPNAGGQISPYAEQPMQGAIFGAIEPAGAASYGVLAGLGLLAGVGFWRALR